jgi:outer membrane receptor protein involved in Fe transport
MHWRAALCAAAMSAVALLARPGIAVAQSSSPSPTPSPTPTAAVRVSEEVVVSATKGPEDAVDVAASVAVVSGDQLRRQGAKTVADALQNVVGLDTGNGSDQGPLLPNIGIWGVKEFDALLVTVDGVPVGGPFNPSLSQIPVEDIDRIEIVRGPQGTLYGVSAFAGMVSVYTRHTGSTTGAATGGGGSFSQGFGSLSYGRDVEPGLNVSLLGSINRARGWQDRTDSVNDRIAVSARKSWGQASLDATLGYFQFTNFFGSPLPVEAGEPMPNFYIGRNYAIQGSRLDHHVVSLTSNLKIPISASLQFQNTFGYSSDSQTINRSFINRVDGLIATGDGSALKPIETTIFDDAHLVKEFQAAGKHRLLGGVSLTWGRSSGAGIGFDYDVVLLPDPIVPSLSDVPVGDHRSFNDQRTFVGLYANDEWTPVRWLTISGGLRFDITSETLHAQAQVVGDPDIDVADDSRNENQFSGGLSAMAQLLPAPAGPLTAVNFYVAASTNFKPAAPNFLEAESARILEPERTVAESLGLKTLWLDGAVGFDVTLFHMMFKNVVVGIQDANGKPALTNAGEELFQGAELALRWKPRAVKGLSIAGGYAHHDARYERFSFITPDGELRVVDGKRVELTPRDLWNFGADYAPSLGPGAFVAVRHQNRRPLNRRNTFYTPSFFETDAGVSWAFPWGQIAAVGRNLGDSRHYVTESEIGDSQFYVAWPRRFTAELTFRF